MAGIFNKKINITCIDDIYAIQHDILELVCKDVQIHFVSTEHKCGEDHLNFLCNAMERYKCVFVPNNVMTKAGRFANIIKNETGYDINFFVPYVAISICDWKVLCHSY